MDDETIADKQLLRDGREKPLQTAQQRLHHALLGNITHCHLVVHACFQHARMGARVRPLLSQRREKNPQVPDEAVSAWNFHEGLRAKSKRYRIVASESQYEFDC